VLYALLALGFSLLAIADSVRMSTLAPVWLAAYVNGFQVALGVPLLLIPAVTALVEERARGSLDILLTTPLSSRRIVLTKWWMVFRRTPRLVLLPAAVAAALACGSEEWWAAVLLIAYVVSAAAAWTSVGLAVSTWVPQLGRAVTVALGLYASLSLAWTVLTITGATSPVLGAGLSPSSPFYGAFHMTFAIVVPQSRQGQLVWSVGGWTIAQTAIAVLLLLATLATFDRAIGRIRERPRGSRRRLLAGGDRRPYPERSGSNSAC
jgi:ABC-type transport system involved in multi-copper enzyme maturation permease subunit